MGCPSGRRGGDLVDACAEPNEPVAGSPNKGGPPDGEEGELVEAGVGGTPGHPALGGAKPNAADHARSGGEEWEVL